MKVKVLSILGSPRKDGNTQLLTENIIKGIQTFQGDIEIDIIFLNKHNIQPCIACDGCHKTIGCIIKDDMADLYSKFDQADLVIIGSPIYFNAVSAQLKAVIDRCQALWASKYILQTPMIDRNKRRLGIFVATAGNPEEYAEFQPSIRIMDLFFRAINTQYYDNLLVDNTDKAPVSSRTPVLDEAYQLGVQLITTLLKEE